MNVVINGILSGSYEQFQASPGYLALSRALGENPFLVWNDFYAVHFDVAAAYKGASDKFTTLWNKSSLFEKTLIGATALAGTGGAMAYVLANPTAVLVPIDVAKEMAKIGAQKRAKEIARMLTLVFPGCRFRLFGHSHGGLIVKSLLWRWQRTGLVGESYVFGCPWEVSNATQQFHCLRDEISRSYDTRSSKFNSSQLIQFPYAGTDTDLAAAHSLEVYADAFARWRDGTLDMK